MTSVHPQQHLGNLLVHEWLREERVVEESIVKAVLAGAFQARLPVIAHVVNIQASWSPRNKCVIGIFGTISRCWTIVAARIRVMNVRCEGQFLRWIEVEIPRNIHSIEVYSWNDSLRAHIPYRNTHVTFLKTI